MSQPECSPVTPVKPPAPWIGGKSKLANIIIERIEAIEHKAYVEPFVGMGGVFFRRKHAPRCEVINDRSGDIANFFRILQRHFDPFMDLLQWQVSSRQEFDRQKRVSPDTLTDLERAIRFYYLQRLTFGGQVSNPSFGVSTDRPARLNVTKVKEHLKALHARLAGVVIENRDWSKIIDSHDRADTLFYLDPPYWNCENDYGKGLFDRGQFEQLAARLASIKGRFILSLNDVPEVRNLFASFQIDEIQTSYSISKNARTVARELLIFNGSPPD